MKHLWKPNKKHIFGYSRFLIGFITNWEGNFTDLLLDFPIMLSYTQVKVTIETSQTLSIGHWGSDYWESTVIVKCF